MAEKAVEDMSIGGLDPKKNRILVAMSGGVDSSVTAALLKSQGFDVVGVYMQLWDNQQVNQERFGSRCSTVTDSNDARRVCDKIDIPFYLIDAKDVFEEHVVDYFVHEYLRARTPNPCIHCNNKIKFNYLFQKADELGCSHVATGHYAQILRDPETGLARLHKALDPQKDQSYFLFGLKQDVLSRTIMPLGGLNKLMVRRLALNFDLANVSEKDESQEICFIYDDGYKKFIEKRIPGEMRPKGMIRDLSGQVMGDHRGLYQFTVGQRKGLNLTIEDRQKKFYVLGWDTTTNDLIIGDEDQLYHQELLASQLNWVAAVDPIREFKCHAKIRSQHKEAPCRVMCFENNGVRVVFDEPQRAITPGQAIVFYKGDRVIGGGFIDRIRHSLANEGTIPKKQDIPGKKDESADPELEGW